MGILALFLVQGKSFQLFITKYDISCGFYHSQLLLCSLYTHFVESFIISECWILSDAFFASVKMVIRFLSLLLMCITLIDLQIQSHPCTLGINPTLLWCTILLMCCWILVCKYFVQDFCISVHQEYWLVVFFLSTLVLVSR